MLSEIDGQKWVLQNRAQFAKNRRDASRGLHPKVQKNYNQNSKNGSITSQRIHFEIKGIESVLEVVPIGEIVKEEASNHLKLTFMQGTR